MPVVPPDVLFPIAVLYSPKSSKTSPSVRTTPIIEHPFALLSILGGKFPLLFLVQLVGFVIRLNVYRAIAFRSPAFTGVAIRLLRVETHPLL